MKSLPLVALGAILLTSCRTELRPVVRTLNPGYDRTRSRALVRSIEVPTRANLDYAAWCGNMILLDTAKVEVHPATVTAESLQAGGLFSDVRARIEDTPLSDSEIAAPMAWKPVEDQWLSWSFDSAGPLVSRVQEFAQKKWGDTAEAYLPYQQIVALYPHKTPEGDELWVRIEFATWMRDHVEGIEDRDGDGFPEVWARLAAPELRPSMVRWLRGDYSTRVLDRAQAVQWANELAALWYPVYNTDMIDLMMENAFPQGSTEPEVVKELGDLRIGEPMAVIRGRPFGSSLYLVFVIPHVDEAAVDTRDSSHVVAGSLDPTLATRLDAIRKALATERESHGGSWEAWAAQAASFPAKARALENSVPAQTQAIAGPSRTLLFRRELSYVQAGDLAGLGAGENPVERIKAFRDSLAGLGIDFLFVPVPTKLDLAPELLSGTSGATVQPWSRKLLDDLAASGVETVDLFHALAGRSLWRRQDTHWKPAGAEAAAAIVASRIEAYPWFAQASQSRFVLNRRDTTWTDFGDLRDRLASAERASWAKEEVNGAVFDGPDGKRWDDAETSPILLVGDSYLGVYQKIPPRGAGFSSYLAADLETPVSVVMGWGGGPEAPKKLAARGPDALKGRRLVVWVMSVRDLFRFPGGWGAR